MARAAALAISLLFCGIFAARAAPQPDAVLNICTSGNCGTGGTGGGPGTVSLTVTLVGTGTGRVEGSTSTGNTFSCSSPSCTFQFVPGTQIKLFRLAASGSVFVRVTGDPFCSEAPSSFTSIDSDEACAFDFSNGPPVTLRVDVHGEGIGAIYSNDGQIACASGNIGTCSGLFDHGATVSFRAIAAAESELTRFGGSLPGPVAIAAAMPAQTCNLEAMLLLSNQTCNAEFEPLANAVAPPAGAVHFTVPEFVQLSRDLADRQDINKGVNGLGATHCEADTDCNVGTCSPFGTCGPLRCVADADCNQGANRGTCGPFGICVGSPTEHDFRAGVNVAWPVTFDSHFGAIDHFQLWQEGRPLAAATDSPFLNSVEEQKDGCIYASYTDSLTPYWLDEFLSVDLTQGINGPGTPIPGQDILRSWAGDLRTFEQIKQQNNFLWFDYFFPNTNHDQSGNVLAPAFPTGRAPAPRWYNSCQGIPSGSDAHEVGALSGVDPQSPFATVSGSYCGFHTAELDLQNPFSQGTLEWSTLCDLRDFSPNALCQANYDATQLFTAEVAGDPWLPSVVTGTMNTSFLSGGDASADHAAWPENTYIGDPAPFAIQNCPRGTAGADFCSDWDGFLHVDPEYRFLLAADRTVTLLDEIQVVFRNIGSFDSEHHGMLETEIEQWAIPNGYRPEAGDRVTMIGRWIVDCGHHDYHTEIHPVELVVSSFLQTGILLEGGVFDSNLSTRAGTRNFPSVVQSWNDGITGHIPATVNKVVVTATWQGRELSVDLWPPRRPSPTSVLRYHAEVPNGAVKNVIVEPTLQPDPSVFHNAANHVHLRIRPMTALDPPDVDSVAINGTGQAEAQDDRGYAGGFLLWWEDSCPNCVDNGRGGGAQ